MNFAVQGASEELPFIPENTSVGTWKRKYTHTPRRRGPSAPTTTSTVEVVRRRGKDNSIITTATAETKSVTTFSEPAESEHIKRSRTLRKPASKTASDVILKDRPPQTALDKGVIDAFLVHHIRLISRRQKVRNCKLGSSGVQCGFLSNIGDEAGDEELDCYIEEEQSCDEEQFGASPSLDPLVFPHLWDNIMSHLQLPELLKLRSVSRSVKDHVDLLLFDQLFVIGDGVWTRHGAEATSTDPRLCRTWALELSAANFDPNVTSPILATYAFKLSKLDVLRIDTGNTDSQFQAEFNTAVKDLAQVLKPTVIVNVLHTAPLSDDGWRMLPQPRTVEPPPFSNFILNILYHPHDVQFPESDIALRLPANGRTWILITPDSSNPVCQTKDMDMSSESSKLPPRILNTLASHIVLSHSLVPPRVVLVGSEMWDADWLSTGMTAEFETETGTMCFEYAEQEFLKRAAPIRRFVAYLGAFANHLNYPRRYTDHISSHIEAMTMDQFRRYVNDDTRFEAMVRSSALN